MARRRKGRDLTGWLLVDKPAGLTSAAVVNKARWLLKARKAGHAGTLDPAATGLLVIAFGAATKCVPLIADALKAYEFTIRWGAATNTDDAEGEVIATSADRPDAAAITAALPAFTGDISQVPPKFSAVKIDGQRAYKLARDGDNPDIAARPLYVDELTLLDCPDADHSRLRLVCGKGGYVRAIARDLGAALGCHGHVTGLRRLWSGPFSLEDAVDWPVEPDPAIIEAALLPLADGLTDVDEVRVAQANLGPLRNGNPVEAIWSETKDGGHCWASVSGIPIALGTYKFGFFHPTRVLEITE